MRRPDTRPWPERVASAQASLARRGHVDPVVAVSTPDGRHSAGDPDLRWEIGSITKLLTSLLLAELARSGEVRLDDRVPDLLPPGTPLAPKVADITLEHLACHRSGLPRLPPGMRGRGLSGTGLLDPYADIDADRLVAGLAETRVQGVPGAAPVRYANYGVGLLGFLLGRATGLGFESTLAARVLAPLGLGGASFLDSPLHQGRSRGRPVRPWHLAALAGAGGLRASAADLLTYLEAVRDCTGPLAQAIVETLRPRVDRGRIRVGLGWFWVGDGDLLLHDGGTLGARSEVRIEPRTGTAVVVLGDGRGGTARAAGMVLNPR
ncbi:MAG: serine hydrolase domain-containing protein [Candidatus Nanopelagicales bacterium]